MSIRRAPLLLAASATATVADAATLLALARFAPIAAGLAAALASVAGGTVNFLLSRRLVFRSRRGDPLRQAIAYALLVVGCGAFFTGLLVQVGITQLHASLLVAKLAAALLVLACWSYPIASRVVFPDRS